MNPKIVSVISLLLLAAASPAYGQTTVPISDIEVFAASNPSINLDRTDFFHVDKAIDGDLTTLSFLTPSGNTLEAIVALELSTPSTVNRFRVNKFQSDTDDNGGTDSMDLQILVTIDSGPLSTRNFVPVSGMVNGYQGAELINASSVVSNGSIIGDVHDPVNGTFWSVTFDALPVTAVAMRFNKVSGPGGPFVHYPVGEFQIFGPSPGATVIAGPIVNPANGHFYYLLNRSLWTEAETEAQSLGGHLATINNTAENQWVFDTFTPLVVGEIPDCPCLWIGYNDVAQEGAFVWTSGKTPGFENWSPYEPNNGGGPPGESYVYLWGPGHTNPGRWNDAQVYGGVDFQPFGVAEVGPTVVPSIQLPGLLLLGVLITLVGRSHLARLDERRSIIR